MSGHRSKSHKFSAVGAKFSNLNLTNVEIEACDTTGMKFRGVLVSDLFDAYKRERKKSI